MRPLVIPINSPPSQSAILAQTNQATIPPIDSSRRRSSGSSIHPNDPISPTSPKITLRNLTVDSFRSVHPTYRNVQSTR